MDIELEWGLPTSDGTLVKYDVTCKVTFEEPAKLTGHPDDQHPGTDAEVEILKIELQPLHALGTGIKRINLKREIWFHLGFNDSVLEDIRCEALDRAIEIQDDNHK